MAYLWLKSTLRDTSICLRKCTYDSFETVFEVLFTLYHSEQLSHDNGRVIDAFSTHGCLITVPSMPPLTHAGVLGSRTRLVSHRDQPFLSLLMPPGFALV